MGVCGSQHNLMAELVEGNAAKPAVLAAAIELLLV